MLLIPHRGRYQAVLAVYRSCAVQLTDSGAEHLFAAAAMEVGLMSLELRSNNLTLRGGRTARSIMFEHPCLESIDMRLNTTPKLALLRVWLAQSCIIIIFVISLTDWCLVRLPDSLYNAPRLCAAESCAAAGKRFISPTR